MAIANNTINVIICFFMVHSSWRYNDFFFGESGLS
jgi:hypothetical protein